MSLNSLLPPWQSPNLAHIHSLRNSYKCVPTWKWESLRPVISVVLPPLLSTGFNNWEHPRVLWVCCLPFSYVVSCLLGKQPPFCNNLEFKAFTAWQGNRNSRIIFLGWLGEPFDLFFSDPEVDSSRRGDEVVDKEPYGWTLQVLFIQLMPSQENLLWIQ